MNNNETVSTQNESTNSNKWKLPSTATAVGCVTVVAVAVASIVCSYIISEHPNCEASFSIGGKDGLFSASLKSISNEGSEEKVSS